ncbi:hypothetical protein GU261_03720 [Vibrio cholerae]|uniref:SagB/ThcOx family dehydrogenase n=2 Tax=Vibrio cholerae TaxID=666 RepID=UPI00155EBE86|nr:SagB/ThcOx family dehydrogenase [Vibrio cholerae]NOE59280.1 hypothetical protein [Vibrio cholerae]
MNSLDYQTFNEMLNHVSPETEKSIDGFYQSTIVPELNGKVLGINNLVSDELLRKCEFSSMDFSLGLSETSFSLPIRSISINRIRSCRSFSSQSLHFGQLAQCLSNAICADTTGRRSYSSAGGLYPVEVFIALHKERLTHTPENFKSGFYYLNSNQKKLILLTPASSKEIKRVVMTHDSYFRSSAFQVITVINIVKSLFKYKERGFRNALIEVGSIHHVLRATFAECGIHSCESAEFNDHRLLDAIALNKRLFKASLVQHFGYPLC